MNNVVNIVSDSRFYMWRTLFAMIHADSYVSEEEVHFMAEILEGIPFSDEQKRILEDDVRNAKSITTMFEGVTDPRDQGEFFTFARELAKVDGNFGAEEQAILLQLQKVHISKTNLDDLIGNVELCFEDEGMDSDSGAASQTLSDKKGALAMFRDMFLSGKK